MGIRYDYAVLVAAVVLVGGVVPASAASPAVSSCSSAVIYAELPINGLLGKDVTAAQVSAALKQAAELKAVKHIVVQIKTPGGQPEAAKEISDLLKSYDGRFTFHASVEQAAGAGVLIALSCPTIALTDSATLGGAAPELEPFVAPASATSSTSSTAVTSPASAVSATPAASATAAKEPTLLGFETIKKPASAQSAVAAKPAGPVVLSDEAVALAGAYGRSPVLARALVTAGGDVYGWKDKAGQVQIADRPAADLAPEQLIVSSVSQTSLTLTSSQTAALRLAQVQHGGSAALGEVLGLRGWKLSGCDLGAIMRGLQAADKRKEAAKAALEKRKADLAAKRKKAKDYIDKNTKEAEDNAPKNGTYTYQKQYNLSGSAERRFDSESTAKWQNLTDRASAYWNKVIQGLQALVPIEKEADSIGLERLMSDKEIADQYDHAQSEIKRLFKDRGNNK